MTIEELIQNIVTEEWEQFQLVNNEGGRASCQDDPTTFFIMRRSQFKAWPEELLASYYDDLTTAKFEGRNLVFTKYAFMMARTAPEQYEQIKHVLPVFDKERVARLEEVVQIQVKMADAFRKQYPVYAGQGRPVYASEEMFGNTSIETYQRGELYSYGLKTQDLYCAFVKQCEAEGINLTYDVRENMVKEYGYKSIDDYVNRIII